MTGIPDLRLRAQRLIGEPFVSPVDAVRWLGAVQSQDYSGAKWALGQRSRGVTDSDLDRLYDDGAILRTHVMRPTWHFVLPDDIRWLLELTGPRIRRGLAARYRELELNDKVVARAGAAFAAALAGGRHLTRTELGEVLHAAGISPAGQRLPHFLAGAELEGLIVSGPRRGKQFTYALLEDRAPKGRVLDRSEAVAELALRYFRSHGPAQVQDFVWWSGLTMADARAGIAGAGAALERQAIDGKDYWSGAGPVPSRKTATIAHLLPNFDEYTVGYRDRSALTHADRRFEAGFFSFGSILSNIVMVDGRVWGAWRRTLTRDGVRVEIRIPHRLQASESAAIDKAGRRLAAFLERPVVLSRM